MKENPNIIFMNVKRMFDNLTKNEIKVEKHTLTGSTIWSIQGDPLDVRF